MTMYNPEPKDINISSSAAELRNYTLAFVSFLLYVLITTASTTHEQLLRISAVKLPLLDIDIPIVQFFLVSPLLILILHFHLLLQHFLFSQQFYAFDKALKLKFPDRQDRVEFMKTLSGNLSLVHLLGGYQTTFVQILLAVILGICLLFFPLFDLWFLQAKFLPFHDNDYTNWQVLLVVLDCVMLLVFLPKIFDEQDKALRWWLSVFSPLWLPKRFYLYSLRRFYHFYYQRGELRLFNHLWLDKAAIKVKLKKLIPKYQAILQVKIISFKRVVVIVGLFSFVTIVFLLSVFVSTLPAFEFEEKENLFINDREKWLTKNKGTVGLTKFLHDDFGFSILYRYLVFDGNVITAEEHLNYEIQNTLYNENNLDKVSGINLKERDLRYAMIYSATLPKAMLEKANLQGANIIYSNFKEADFLSATLQSVQVIESQLQGSKFGGTDLKEFVVGNSNLKGVIFETAKLQNAHFNKLKLQGSTFRGVDLQEADLNGELQGVYLSNNSLKGTNLSSSSLEGAYLKNIEYGIYIDPESQESKQTLFPVKEELKWKVPCLTDDAKLPICKKYHPADTETLNKITSYWINDLACSDKWIAQGIMRNYLFNEENSAKFKTYLIPLLKNKLKDTDCTGIQNLSDDFKQQIKDAIKQP